MGSNAPGGVQVTIDRPADRDVLTDASLAFVADLTRAFRPRIEQLLSARRERQAALDGGASFDFLGETEHVRQGDWRVAPVPADLADRRVEITGPVDRKMVINALNSGANVFMADFEDATCPTWDNLVQGQINLKDAIRGTIRFEGGGKSYTLGSKIATLFVRPRGLHLFEKHVLVDGAPAPGSLFDFGLYFFHNARALLERKKAPYFYIPKLESHVEARLWNDVFVFAQKRLDIPLGSIRATVLIETLPAAFEMDEILYELRDHSAGLNCGRWDYIFSFIKKRRNDARAVLPDRAAVTMDKAFLRAYSEKLIATCHRRGVHAMGGMAAQIPIKDDPAANEAALAKVRADKLREVKAGHDGTWVAHPALVSVAREIFDAHMPRPNQIDVRRDDVSVGRAELLEVPAGARTIEGLRHNVRVGVQYIEAWLRGQGCVPLYHLMEDAATAEISRAQVWQWLHHKVALEDGTPVTRALVTRVVDEELAALESRLGDAFAKTRLPLARDMFETLATQNELTEFLTVPAYDKLLVEGQ